MSGVATAVVGAAVIGGVVASNNADKASDAQKDGADKAIRSQADMYNQTREDQQPWQQAGQNALAQMMQEMGYGVTLAPDGSQDPSRIPLTQAQIKAGGKQNLFGSLHTNNNINRSKPSQLYAFSAKPSDGAKPLFGGFQADPGFAFRQQQGNEALNNSLAARGGLLSGNALRAGMEYNSGLASQEYGNYWNRLAAIAGIGQTANNTMASVGQGAAANIGNSQMAAGNARASGYAAQGQAYGNAINQAGNALGNYFSQQQGGGGGQMQYAPYKLGSWNGISDYNAAEIWQ